MCIIIALKRESGENPERSRRCKDEVAFQMPLSLDGKANANDDSKSEYLPVIEVRETTSDGPHEVLAIKCVYKPFPVERFFIFKGLNIFEKES